MAPRSKKRRRSAPAREVKTNGWEEEQDEQAEQVADETIDDPMAGGDGEDAPEQEAEDKHEPTEQEIEEWESFREEFYDIVHELPVSLQRSYRLMRELDDDSESYAGQLLPVIKEYIAFRKALLNPPEPEPVETAATADLAESAVEPNGVLHPSPNGVPTTNGASAPSPTTQDDTQVCNGPSPDSQTGATINNITSPTKASRKRKRSALDDQSPRRSPRISRSSSSQSPTKPSTPGTISPITPPVNGVIAPNSLQLESATELPASSSIKAKEPELPGATTRRMLGRVAELASNAVKASEEKVGIALAMYDLVDRHVRSLDAKMQEYEASLSIGLRPGTHPLDGTLTFGHGDRSTVSIEPDSTRGRKRDRKGKQRAVSGEEEAEEEPEGHINSLMLGLAGMPVDIAEPRYCYCNRVSFGVMVGCDGPNCPHGGWFHLECVGLTEVPKGSFFCEDCAKQHPRGPKRKR